MEVPEQAKANEVFEMKADLQKLSDDEVRMMHAGGVFYFTIRDSGGNQVNTFAMVDVGISRVLKEKITISESYAYKLAAPGNYKVSATARFTMMEGGVEKRYELQTDEASLEIIPKKHFTNR
ncbi:hypothetical protein ACI5FR_26455 [Paenibacillus sp. HJGM_3]